MSCARWTVPEGVALFSCENIQVGSDVREDGSAGATEPAGGGQIRPAAVIFAKGEDGPAGSLRRRWTSWSNKLDQLEHYESAGSLWTSCCVKMKKNHLENKSDVDQLLRKSCIRRSAKTKIQQLMCKDKLNQLES
ncbi:hypothetical protein F511_39329 [Dorcoceras hygrometricum]|uniref:Uncharacterized protein n=1 Tax=Dorcoceras hygrometricum TaxID=472368 RepID=A0A2Z7APY7_9LAMI|nr:hypothetical protein F511_39329 [Dorcoceras hygrometricum]